jgi:glycosyltransferase involved in cell wall biosynthesis
MPNVYFAIERLIVKSLSSAWCVRQDGVNAMRQRYPDQSERINFVPTWVDTEVFSPPDDIRKSQLRNQYVEELGIDTHSLWVVSVGRLDSQKDPSLMLAAFDYLVKKGILLTWLVIGDGVLREGLQRQVCEAGLSAQVRFLGLKSPGDIADLLRASDVFALSSAYEGMPMALLEALGSGLPVATTDVGEVRRVVKPGVNGAIAADRSVESFVACLSDVIAHVDQYKGEAAVQAIQDFQPKKVLATVFDNYRLLGRRARESRARTNKIT